LKVTFSRRAERDLMDQINWLSAQARAAALQAADQIEATVALLQDFPFAAPEVDDRHREITVPFGRDGFVLRYRVGRDRVTIVRVFHGRQQRHRQP
jgi:plasmid stabilization system protein ParE